MAVGLQIGDNHAAGAEVADDRAALTALLTWLIHWFPTLQARRDVSMDRIETCFRADCPEKRRVYIPLFWTSLVSRLLVEKRL